MALVREGLSSQRAAELLKQFGLNEITEEKQGRLALLARRFVSPISLLLLAAAGLSLFGGRLPDAWFIAVLWVLNGGIQFWHEHKADTAVAQLAQSLRVTVTTHRDGRWQEVDSRQLVPGDLVSLGPGDVVPADAVVQETTSGTVNNASLTGESLPKEIADGETVYAGAFLVSGRALCEVLKTGNRTYFGKTLLSIEDGIHRSILEQDIVQIAKILSIASAAAIVILTVFFLLQGTKLTDLITLDLSLLIAGIPVSLPTVMSMIISIGALKLAHKHVVVRRLSSLEDLANVSQLYTDKTGTLTKNEITVHRVIEYGVDEMEVVRYARLATEQVEKSTIDKAILRMAQARGIAVDDVRVLSFVPADSKRKHSTTVVNIDGKVVTVSVGAPQVVAELSTMNSSQKQVFAKDVEEAANEGYRSLAVAIRKGSQDETNMTMIGILLLSDTVREGAPAVVRFLREHGVRVSMVTGDHHAIAQRTARTLGIDARDVYAEVLPDEKLRLVELARERAVVAVTGDGVNDLPAIKAADIGVAVRNAVSALRSSADIVLLSEGIGVIKDAFIEARNIFARLYTYSVYRLSESFRLIITITVLGVLYRSYPLTPIQLILLALLNDIPIISLAFNRVENQRKPSEIHVKQRLVLSLLFGMVGVVNSLLMFLLVFTWLGVPLATVETIFFLKLAVSGHMLIYVAHTKRRWWRQLPSRAVIVATTTTQLIATGLVMGGIFMPAISWQWVLVVWVWAFLWMQVTEFMKDIQQRLVGNG